MRIAKGVGDVQFAQTGDRDDIARFSFGGFNTLQTEVSQYFTDFTVTCFTFAVDQSDLLVRFHTATFDTTDADYANVVVVIQLGDLHLERTIKINARCFNVVNDSLVQRGHVFRHISVVVARDTHQC
ncbi:hypothetical protein D3C78_1443710 [compost metagenome]